MSQNNTAYQPVTNDDYYAKPLDIHNEKAIVNQMPTLLLIDDDEIFDGEEENYISLPSTSLSSCSSNSSDFDHIKYVNSIRKNRPLPKIPDRASSKEVSSHSLTAIINDSFKNQHRMSAQQLFEIMNSSKSVSSGEEEEEGDTSDEDEEYGGVFAIKTQMPSPTLSNKETLQQYYSELVGNYKMMTPVEEVEEEDQLFEAYVEEQHGASTPNYLLEPIEVSHLRLTSNNNTPSLISGRTSPSSQSIDVYLQQTQIEEPSSQQCGQEQLLEKVDTLNGVDSMYYAPTNSYDLQSKNDDTSLLNDVQKLSRLSRALMTPVVSSEALPTLTTLQQSYSPVGSIDEERVSPHPVASFSLTHDKDSIKTYRRMATKTHDRNIQFTYTKYLMQLVSTYTTMNDMDNEAKEMRNRLQEEAEYWIDKLAKSNFAGALYIKGLWHRHCCDRKAAGLFVGSQYKKVNHAKAFKCFQQAAKYGSTEAHYELAEYWMVRKEYKKSMASYRYAASKNHILSLYKLANIMLRGLLNQKKDVQRGLIYLKQAANSDNPESARSAYDLACIYSNDLESIDLERTADFAPYLTMENQASVIHYLSKADKYGLVSATFRLGQIYKHGQQGILLPDPQEAYHFFLKAAESNHEGAMLELSQYYKDGIADYVDPHPMMAFKWCHRAAQHDNEIAEYTVGTYYEYGVGVAPNIKQAKEWYSKSASKGYGPAQNKLNNISKPEAQLESLQRPLQQLLQRQQQNVIKADSNNTKRYYEESVRIAEKSRRTRTEQNCQMM